MDNNYNSQEVSAFHERTAPEPGTLAGYGAIIELLKLEVPIPRQLAMISKKHKKYSKDNWLVLTPKHQPKNTLYDHLVFALKYEGINLLFFKKLFEKISQDEIEKWIKTTIQGQYARKIWFLYEWLNNRKLNLPDLKEGNYVPLLDDKLQYSGSSISNSKRHRIKNNLPGTSGFCPLIHKTAFIEKCITENYSHKFNLLMNGIHRDIIQRTASFLLLKDSKASFRIENEDPGQTRAIRWGKAIGQAGGKALSKEELLRLQQIVIENSRFIKMGYRTQGGFVGEHDRVTGEPIPDHISARLQDIETLMEGLLDTAKLMERSMFHPVLTAAAISFGFVFIHPFEDGNGRIHRYLIHHLLASMKYTPQGIIFPVSAAILEHINDYRIVLENYSQPLINFIRWKKTPKNNIEVINETIDYYRYFDATEPVEFLYKCVDYTINKIVPAEVAFLQSYDTMKSWLDDRFQMPDKTVALLVRFLKQNDGKFSKRAREKEFIELTDDEVKIIEEKFNSLFSI